MVKTSKEKNYYDDLEDIMWLVWKHIVCLNPAKCSFDVQEGNFLGFMLTIREIETTPNKCQAIINMWSPKIK